MQLCIANLAGAAAAGVTAKLEKTTAWPNEFYFQDSAILRDLKYLRPHEVLSFDLGVGPDLFQDGVPACFHMRIDYTALDGRQYQFDEAVLVESVEGHSGFVIYTIDDVARRLRDIHDVLKKVSSFSRVRVETYNAADREDEKQQRQRAREDLEAKQR